MLISFLSCTENDERIVNEVLLEEFENSLDAIRIVGFTPSLFYIIEELGTKGVTVEEAFKNERVKKLNSVLLNSYRKLKAEYGEETLSKLSIIAFQQRSGNWLHSRIEDEKSRDPFLSNLNSESVKAITCGQTCPTFEASSMAHSCI